MHRCCQKAENAGWDLYMVVILLERFDGMVEES